MNQFPISKISIYYFIKISVTPNPISTSIYCFIILHWVKKKRKTSNSFHNFIILLTTSKKKKIKISLNNSRINFQYPKYPSVILSRFQSLEYQLPPTVSLFYQLHIR